MSGPHMLREACHALCQSGKFETGQGTCAAICMGMLGSARGKPHGCDYAMKVHEDLAAAVLKAAAAPELLEALAELADLMDHVNDGNYTPDSFTTQPARNAIAKATGAA